MRVRWGVWCGGVGFLPRGGVPICLLLLKLVVRGVSRGGGAGLQGGGKPEAGRQGGMGGRGGGVVRA